MNPVLLSVLYRTSGDFHVALIIRGHNNPALSLYVIHERIDSTASVQSFPAIGESEEIIVQDGESITVLARNECGIVASALFQVNTDLLEECSMILAPVSLMNIHADQCERAMVSVALQRALEAAFAENSAQPMEVQVL